ncbi:unnamed protein product [Orchesella dallaii]|uniref:Uncharacterized protein n=1 Tax=Orchesella dallaii TaxID=48710 RepID=A0ABP1RR01_9HEXA
MAVKHKFVILLLAFGFLASFTVTGDDYQDYDVGEIVASVKGEAPPPAAPSPEPLPNTEPVPPPPPPPSTVITTCEVDPTRSSNVIHSCYLTQIFYARLFRIFLNQNSVLNTDDKLAMYVKPTCTNVPKFNTSIDWRWENTVSEVRVPEGKCIRLFDTRDCCGRTLDISSKGPILYKEPNWNDKAKSFATCDYAGGCPGNGGDDSSLAIFYEAHGLKGYDTLALEIQECCINIPDTKTTKNGVWNKGISEIKLPGGKYLRNFEKPNCEGEHLDVSNEAKPHYVVSSGFNDRIQSFMSISKEIVVNPCEDLNGIFELNVKPTCTIAPDPGIDDLVVPNNNCICLFDQPECTGVDLTVSTNQDKDFIVREGFHDKTRSFRACNRHLEVSFDNSTR